MEHRKKGRKLKRTASHKKALLSNLSNSLIKHKRIKTTVAKAKELRMYIEPVVNKAKIAHLAKEKDPDKYVHLVREIRKFLKERVAIQELIAVVAPKVVNRNGGYTRVLKTGFRPGDGADEAIIELVDFSVVGEAEKPKTAKKSTEVKTEDSKTQQPQKKTAKEKAGKSDKENKPEKTKTKDKEEKPKKEAVKKEAVKKEVVKKATGKKEAIKKETVKKEKKATAKKKTPVKNDKKGDS